MNGHWKAVEVAVPVHMHPVHINNFITAEIHIRARRAGEAVANVRIGAPRESRGDFIAWTASYLPAPQVIAA
ncbi:hypothetical protein MGALJ_21790 [Mycobacterium gallinarum]|uniref:Uncharacterized protein n=1 Tax=Mycobacterium gallinarum TaxID=39689 RepID=A0A9W4B7V0_9MYCO|nr:MULTISPECIES: hypothetical protein [Mycobacterium]MDV3135352.1 hypothetical protein [Mycobacterium sp. 29Ha]BBY92510.1 hypothetical protein MGALJ_21790 [Mycobacterium gallinarum]